MIRNPNFIKRQIGAQSVIVAVGEATKSFHGMISINGSAAFIWDLLEKEISLDEITAAVVDRYEIDEETARRDAAEFTDTLKGVGAIA